MSETLHEMAVRVRKKMCGRDCCTDCKYKDDKPCFVSALCYVDNADEQIENLKRWARKHPPHRTWLERYNAEFGTRLRTYPKCHVGMKCRPTTTVRLCPHNVYGVGPERTPGCGGECINDCRKCWNSEVTEE